MNKRLLGLLLAVIVFFAVSNMGHASAALPRTNGIPVCAAAGDTQLFPFGFMCGTHPEYQDPIQMSIDNITGGGQVFNGGSVANGSILTVNMTWTNATGNPKRDSSTQAPSPINPGDAIKSDDGLSFVTMNAVTPDQSDNLIASAITPSGGQSAPCPGDGGAGHGKIWGDRDLDPDSGEHYDQTAANNRTNQSPYAYNPDAGGTGVINCNNHGRMVYWIDKPEKTKSYSFNLRLGDDLVSSQICVRGNLAIKYKNDIRYFPVGSPNNSGAPGTGSNGALSVGENQKITATHLVKQSNRLCFSVFDPPPPQIIRGSLNAQCDRSTGNGSISGRINEYYPAGGYKDHVVGWNVSVRVLDIGLPVSFTSIGSTTTNGSGDYSIGLPVVLADGTVVGQNADQLFFGGGTNRAFEIFVKNPNVTSGPYSSWTRLNATGGGLYFYRGADLDCHRDPPTVNASANCEDGVITGTASDPDSPGTNRSLEIHIDAGRVGDPKARITPPSGFRSDPSSGGYSYAIPTLQDGYDYEFIVYAVDNDAANPPGNSSTTASMAGCGHFTLEPGASGSLQPSDEDPTNFAVLNTITASYGTTGIPWLHPTKPAIGATATNSLTKDGLGITGTGFPSYTSFINRDFNSMYPIPAGSFVAGNQYCTSINIGPYTGIARRSDGYVLKVTSANKSANRCDTVNNKPFFKVYGGSVSAGGNFTETGSCSGGGVLSGFYRNDTVNPAFKYGQGSSTELAALGIGQVKGFASAQKRVDKSPIGLTFANQGVAWPINSDPSLGGLYGGDHCLDNAEPPSRTGAITTTLPGGSTINATTIPVGENRSIFVNGDVYINGDITYAGSGGGWTPDNVPSLVVKAVGGNIYIDNDVKNLDGLYIAEATGAAMNKGQIYSCSNGLAPIAQNDLYDNCYKQLTVHGNFVARKVNLMRTYGSLRDEKPTAGTPTVNPGPDQAGLKNRPKWSENSVPDGYFPDECIEVFEGAESPSGIWTDNYLCISSLDMNAGVRVGWNSANGTPTDENGTALTHCEGRTPTEGNMKFIQNLGEPVGHTWYDNNLCSNVEVNIGTAYNLAQAEAASGGPWLCDQMYDNGDNHIPYWKQNNNIKIYICLKKFVAGSAGAAAVLPVPKSPLVCSNSRIGSKSYIPTAGRPETCAAEVFDFSPEFYLSQPSINPPSGGAIIYDAITSLPPVL